MSELQIETILKRLDHITVTVEGILDAVTDIRQEQNNLKFDIRRSREKNSEESINAKQRYEVLNARINGIAKLIKENHKWLT